MEIPSNADPSMPTRLDWLCTQCSSLFDGTASFDEYQTGFARQQYHHNINELRASVKLGCHLCTFRLGNISDKDIRALNNALTPTSNDRRKVNPDHRLIAVFVVPRPAARPGHFNCVDRDVHFRIQADLDIPLPSLGHRDTSWQDVLMEFELSPVNCKILSSSGSRRQR